MISFHRSVSQGTTKSPLGGGDSCSPPGSGSKTLDYLAHVSALDKQVFVYFATARTLVTVSSDIVLIM